MPSTETPRNLTPEVATTSMNSQTGQEYRGRHLVQRPDHVNPALIFLVDVEANHHCQHTLGSHYLSTIRDCSKRRCPLCLLRYDIVKKFSVGSKPSRNTILRIKGSDLEAPILSLQGLWEPFDIVDDNGSNKVEFFSDEEDHAGVDISFQGRSVRAPPHYRIVPYTTHSKHTAQDVKVWLTKCDRDHLCRDKALSLPMPRRVLDISDDRIRLVETGTENDRYVCLSHRWERDDHMLRTTTENLVSFKLDIPWAQLSKTFQEAIKFVRYLGLKYIWIDSLCIIQNIRQDWQEQSALMATIYSNAYLTVAAGCSTLSRTWSKDAKHSLARLQRPDGTSIPIYGRKGFQHSVSDFPLLQRGWVYQERLLSPRIIYFSDAEVIWECREARDCQCGLATCEWPARPRVPVNFQLDPPHYFGGPDPPHERWRGVIKDYSQLELTYPNDIFPALSGLAQAFKETMNDEYAAGFWVQRMGFDLLWYRKGFSNPFVRSSVDNDSILPRWRAPSWSWASTGYFKSPIEFLPCTKSLVKILEVETEASGIDPYGELNTAILRLKARSISASMKHGTITIAGIVFSRDTCRYEGTVDPYAATTQLVGMEYLNTGRFRDLRALQFGSHVEDLPLGRSTDAWLHACFRREVRSYMIIASDTADLTHWKRVGLMVVVANVSDPSYNRPLENAHYTNRAVFQAFDKAAFLEYTIW